MGEKNYKIIYEMNTIQIAGEIQKNPSTSYNGLTSFAKVYLTFIHFS
jgi:hypothetical protein